MLGHLTYLAFELVWAAPVLGLQWLAGGRALWQRRSILLIAIALPSAYLSIADGVAIAHGIWTLHDGRILGIRIGDVPVEEAVFFVLTNAMVVQSVILVSAYRRRSGPS